MRPLFSAGLLAAGITAAALATAAPAAAHGDTIDFRISVRADGHPRAAAVWHDDGDPVGEPVAAALSAVSSDGRTVGPWRLVAVPGARADYTTAEALPPGSWRITVESGFPDLGRGEAEATVTAVPEGGPGTAPAGAPPSAPPPSPAPPSAGVPSAGPAAPAGGRAGAARWVAATATALVASGAALLLLRRRRRRTG